MNEKFDLLIKQLNGISEISASSVTEILDKCNFDIDSINSYSEPQHDPKESYGRKEVYRNNRFQILVMTWLPEDYSIIHDHGNVDLSVIQVFGGLIHNSFECDNRKLQLIKCEETKPSEILCLGLGTIHQMGNENNELIMSLHIYLYNENVESYARNYDLYSGEILHTDQGAYYCVEDEFISKRDFGLVADTDLVVEETFRRNYRQEMMKRN